MGTSDRTRQLQPLARATAMAFDAEMMRLRRIAARETRLRDGLAELDARASERFLSSVEDAGGAALNTTEAQDRAWRDWLSMRREVIQTELAHVLAEKSEFMGRLARTMGRRDVSAHLLDQSRARDRAETHQAEIATLQALSLLRAARDRG